MTNTALPAPVAAAVAAANAGDIDAFLAVFAPDGSVDDWGRVFTGPEAIRHWSDREFVGVDVSLDIRGVTTDGGTTTILAEVGGSGFNGPSHFAFTVQGDHVTLMRITG